MKSTSIFLTVALLLSVHVRAQTNSLDSLEILCAGAYRCYLSAPDSALGLAQRILDNAIALNDTYYEGKAYFLFAKTHWVKANYRLSTEYGYKALKIFRGSSHYEELAGTLLCLGRNLGELGNFEEAQGFIKDALVIGVAHSDEHIQAAAYREQSFLKAELNELDSALHYSDKSLTLFQKFNDARNISILYGRKSRIFFQQKRYQASREFAYRGLKLDSLVGNSRALGISYYQTAQNEHALGNVARAISHLRQSVRINNEIGNLNWQIKAHELLATLYLQQNRPVLSALEWKKASQYKDELYNSQKHSHIQEMRSLHDLEVKERLITFLARENLLTQRQVQNQKWLMTFLLAGILLLSLLIFVLTRLRSMQKKTNRALARQNLEIEQQRVAILMQAENLGRLDRLKTKLFSVISHDLRGPIWNLQALLDMFTKNLMTTEEFTALSHKLKENLNLTQRTLENLLSWSLSQMGGIRTERKKMPVNACIDEACSLMEGVAARKNITFRKEYDGSMLVWADADQLQVVLRNVIQNAIKFSSLDDHIILRTSVKNNLCIVSVKDSGIGMSDEEIETIIESEQFFSKTGTEQEKGTGLGLLLCKEFITRNGGELSIKSILGQGTDVSFTLCLAEHENMPQMAISG